MKSPKLVIYGFIEHHEYRNVARSEWLHVLELFSWKGHEKTPYGTIGKNNKLRPKIVVGFSAETEDLIKNSFDHLFHQLLQLTHREAHHQEV